MMERFLIPPTSEDHKKIFKKQMEDSPASTRSLQDVMSKTNPEAFRQMDNHEFIATVGSRLHRREQMGMNPVHAVEVTRAEIELNALDTVPIPNLDDEKKAADWRDKKKPPYALLTDFAISTESDDAVARESKRIAQKYGLTSQGTPRNVKHDEQSFIQGGYIKGMHPSTTVAALTGAPNMPINRLPVSPDKQLGSFNKKAFDKMMKTIEKPKGDDPSLLRVAATLPSLSALGVDPKSLDVAGRTQLDDAKETTKENARLLSLMSNDAGAMAQPIVTKIGERSEEVKTVMHEEVEVLRDALSKTEKRKSAARGSKNPEIHAEYSTLRSAEKRIRRNMNFAIEREDSHLSYERHHERFLELERERDNNSWGDYLVGKTIFNRAQAGWHSSMMKRDQYFAWEANKLLEIEHDYALRIDEYVEQYHDQPVRQWVGTKALALERWATQTALWNIPRLPVRLGALGVGIVTAGIWAGWGLIKGIKKSWDVKENNWLKKIGDIFGTWT